MGSLHHPKMATGTVFFFLILAPLGFVAGDTPANCTYDDIEGTWIFHESERSQTSDIDCSGNVAFEEKMKVDLTYPNAAVDQFGNIGTWTMVYNQGFEVNVNGRSFFAFSDYKQLPDKGGVVSHCDRTRTGWSHDVTVRNWACFRAIKATRGEEERLALRKFRPTSLQNSPEQGEKEYNQEQWKVDKINNGQSSWVATSYAEFQGMKMKDIERLKGGKKSRLHHKPSPHQQQHQRPLRLLSSMASKDDGLPESWDWRNVAGVNFVSEVRDQGKCGSCYAFSSMGMLESRLNILTKNTKRYTFSTQDVVSCSKLSQGCDGGFPFLVAGRYGKDFGVVEEDCNPYNGTDDAACSTRNCLRHFTASYKYVGGYYGACNELEMKKALVQNGPLSVSFEVYDDFMMYKSGVYHHTKLLTSSGFQPFELTNHAVLLVGYGHDAQLGEDYWIIKNSWGTAWGEDGYFRIRRGTDECAIESIAVEAFPIP